MKKLGNWLLIFAPYLLAVAVGVETYRLGRDAGWKERGVIIEKAIGNVDFYEWNSMSLAEKNALLKRLKKMLAPKEAPHDSRGDDPSGGRQGGIPIRSQDERRPGTTGMGAARDRGGVENLRVYHQSHCVWSR